MSQPLRAFTHTTVNGNAAAFNVDYKKDISEMINVGSYIISGPENTTDRMTQMMNGFEENLDKLGSDLQKRYKSLVCSQISLKRYRHEDYDIKAVKLDLHVGKTPHKTFDQRSRYFENKTNEHPSTADDDRIDADKLSPKFREAIVDMKEKNLVHNTILENVANKILNQKSPIRQRMLNQSSPIRRRTRVYDPHRQKTSNHQNGIMTGSLTTDKQMKTWCDIDSDEMDLNERQYNWKSLQKQNVVIRDKLGRMKQLNNTVNMNFSPQGDQLKQERLDDLMSKDVSVEEYTRLTVNDMNGLEMSECKDNGESVSIPTHVNRDKTRSIPRCRETSDVYTKVNVKIANENEKNGRKHENTFVKSAIALFQDNNGLQEKQRLNDDKSVKTLPSKCVTYQNQTSSRTSNIPPMGTYNALPKLSHDSKEQDKITTEHAIMGQRNDDQTGIDGQQNKNKYESSPKDTSFPQCTNTTDKSVVPEKTNHSDIIDITVKSKEEKNAYRKTIKDSVIDSEITKHTLDVNCKTPVMQGFEVDVSYTPVGKDNVKLYGDSIRKNIPFHSVEKDLSEDREYSQRDGQRHVDNESSRRKQEQQDSSLPKESLPGHKEHRMQSKTTITLREPSGKRVSFLTQQYSTGVINASDQSNQTVMSPDTHGIWRDEDDADGQMDARHYDIKIEDTTGTSDVESRSPLGIRSWSSDIDIHDTRISLGSVKVESPSVSRNLSQDNLYPVISDRISTFEQTEPTIGRRRFPFEATCKINSQMKTEPEETEQIMRGRRNRIELTESTFCDRRSRFEQTRPTIRERKTQYEPDERNERQPVAKLENFNRPNHPSTNKSPTNQLPVSDATEMAEVRQSAPVCKHIPPESSRFESPVAKEVKQVTTSVKTESPKWLPRQTLPLRLVNIRDISGTFSESSGSPSSYLDMPQPAFTIETIEVKVDTHPARTSEIFPSQGASPNILLSTKTTDVGTIPELAEIRRDFHISDQIASISRNMPTEHTQEENRVIWKHLDNIPGPTEQPDVNRTTIMDTLNYSVGPKENVTCIPEHVHRKKDLSIKETLTHPVDGSQIPDTAGKVHNSPSPDQHKHTREATVQDTRQREESFKHDETHLKLVSTNNGCTIDDAEEMTSISTCQNQENYETTRLTRNTGIMSIDTSPVSLTLLPLIRKMQRILREDMKRPENEFIAHAHDTSNETIGNTNDDIIVKTLERFRESRKWLENNTTHGHKSTETRFPDEPDTQIQRGRDETVATCVNGGRGQDLYIAPGNQYGLIEQANLRRMSEIVFLMENVLTLPVLEEERHDLWTEVQTEILILATEIYDQSNMLELDQATFDSFRKLTHPGASSRTHGEISPSRSREVETMGSTRPEHLEEQRNLILRLYSLSKLLQNCSRVNPDKTDTTTRFKKLIDMFVRPLRAICSIFRRDNQGQQTKESSTATTNESSNTVSDTNQPSTSRPYSPTQLDDESRHFDTQDSEETNRKHVVTGETNSETDRTTGAIYIRNVISSRSNKHTIARGEDRQANSGENPDRHATDRPTSITIRNRFRATFDATNDGIYLRRENRSESSLRSRIFCRPSRLSQYHIVAAFILGFIIGALFFLFGPDLFTLLEECVLNVYSYIMCNLRLTYSASPIV